MRTFLSAYTIRIEKNMSKKDRKEHLPQYCKMNSFDGHSDFRDVMEDFLKHLTVNITNDTHKTYMKVIQTGIDGRSIYGVLESGIYGLSSNLRNVDTNSITYKKKKAMPMFFHSIF